MPNLDTTRGDIESFVDVNVSPILPIAYDNVPFDSSGLSTYTHLSLSFNGSSNVNIGGGASKHIRHVGDIVFKLYNKIDSGTSSAFVLLDSIKTQMENKYISSNLITYAAEPIRKGVGKEGFYTYFLKIPFVSDEC